MVMKYVFSGLLLCLLAGCSDAVSASAEGAESTDNAAGYPQYGAALQG
jgi:hypothetical protein